MIPDAFHKFANMFHQDTTVIYASIEDAIQDAVFGLTAEERQILKDYVDHLLNGQYDDSQLEKIWDETPAKSGGFGISQGRPGDARRSFEIFQKGIVASINKLRGN